MSQARTTTSAATDEAGAAIARVLQSERDASQTIEHSRVAAAQLKEDARTQARRLAERTEQRIRSVQAAFERERERRLAAIDADVAQLSRTHEPGAEELAALERAVQALAQELTGAPG